MQLTLAALVVVPVVVVSSAASSGAATPAPASHPSVTVTRDTDGIPHIVAPDFEGLGYGEAWAFAQDNFCTLAQDFVTVNGDRSRYFGPNGLSLNYSAGTSNSNLNSDLFWKMIKQTHPVSLFDHAAPPIGPLPEITQVYRGFVNGYNAYLRSGNLHDPTCDSQPWIRPINLEDMYLRGIQISTEASSQQFITREVDAVPPGTPAKGASPSTSTVPRTTAPATSSTTAGSTTSTTSTSPTTSRTAPPTTTPPTSGQSTTTDPPPTGTTSPAVGGSSSGSGQSGGQAPAPAPPPPTVSLPPSPPAPSTSSISSGLAALKSEFGVTSNDSEGSNGIALGSSDTVNYDGMVLANPHFPWRGTERFWMAQLTVPGQYNVMGGTLEGFPLIGIGFNQDLAWTHTVSTDGRFTFYRLNLVPGDPTSYYLDGTPTRMGQVTVHVETGHGVVTHTFYTTVWGTIADVQEADYTWGTTNAYAVDDSTINDTFRAADQYLRMGQSTSVAGLLQVESQYLAIPTFNTIAADNSGSVLYADVGNTPNVPLSMIDSPCLPSGLPTVVYKESGLITLDGSTTACAWKTDPDTPVPGIFDASQLPHTIRTDYVENSNDSYWLANPSDPFPAYSPIIGNIDVPQGLRTRLGNQMIAQRLAGTDGLGPPKFTIPTLQQMWESDQSKEAQLVLASLVGACNATPQATASNGVVVDLRGACRALSEYNGTGSLDAKGGWLFSEWAGFAPSNFWTTPFNPSEPLTTPSGLDTSNPGVLRALADAVQNLQAQGLRLDVSYRQVQYYQAADNQRIAIHGCDTGCFNAIYASDGTGGPLSSDPYGEVYEGSSLVMTTELTPEGPVSQGILTYSQATDPTSPWASNMSRLYKREQWVPMRYTPAELAADHGATTVSLTY